MKPFTSALAIEVKRITLKEHRATLRAILNLRHRVKALEQVSGSGGAQAFAPGALRALLKFATLQARHKASGPRLGVRGPSRAGGLTTRHTTGPQLPVPSPAAIQKMRGAMSRAEFAKAIGVSVASLYAWETGAWAPKGEGRARLARFLKKHTAKKPAAKAKVTAARKPKPIALKRKPRLPKSVAKTIAAPPAAPQASHALAS